jgi:hypothetical protein
VSVTCKRYGTRRRYKCVPILTEQMNAFGILVGFQLQVSWYICLHQYFLHSSLCSSSLYNYLQRPSTSCCVQIQKSVPYSPKSSHVLIDQVSHPCRTHNITYCAWLQASSLMWMRTGLFWVFCAASSSNLLWTFRDNLSVPSSILSATSSVLPWRWDRLVVPKRRYEITTTLWRNDPEERSSQHDTLLQVIETLIVAISEGKKE